MSISLYEIIERLQVICHTGYVKSHRSGSTGVGKTLEDLLGIKENNIASPDLHRLELKSIREDSNSLITLFTLDRKAWQIRQHEAILKFGSVTEENGRKNLYSTVTGNENQMGFKYRVTLDSVEIWHRSKICLAKWSLDQLSDKYNEKIRHILLITAKVQRRRDGEYFWYYRGSLLMGYMTPMRLQEILLRNVLKIDLRLHLRTDGSVRNHGTGFRVSEADWAHLFRSNDEFSLQNTSDFPYDNYRGFFD